MEEPSFMEPGTHVQREPVQGLAIRPPSCGHPTRDGASCRRPPLAGGAGRCSRHAGLPSTKAERDAAKRAALKHGYFLSGFLDEEERRMFHRICDGYVDPRELARQTVAAMYIRAMRMTFWESEDGDPSPMTTAAFAQLHRALEGAAFDAINTRFRSQSEKDRARREYVRTQLGPEGLQSLREEYAAELASPHTDSPRLNADDKYDTRIILDGEGTTTFG